MGEVLDESGEFKDLDKTDQERVRTKYAITDYNKRTEEEKTKSSKARVALLSRINDGKVTREDYQKDELYGQLLPLDQQYIIYDIESKERADVREKELKRLSDETQESSMARSALLDKARDGLVTKDNYKIDPLFLKLSPLAREYMQYEMENIDRDANQQESIAQQNEEADRIKAEAKVKKELLDGIDSDIQKGLFSPERDPRYLELDEEAKKSVDRLITVRQRKVIS